MCVTPMRVTFRQPHGGMQLFYSASPPWVGQEYCQPHAFSMIFKCASPPCVLHFVSPLETVMYVLDLFAYATTVAEEAGEGVVYA